ncbi:uncharacterized protein LOC131038536 isoform X2 [Cryptomeria japonica]|uniref:uncharacterized protein LOC131038536 isoform X2 n=1 Tax=Cryptomeria japonica TaxID=3369 RepID=UPI0025ACDA8A|nr:uncharacterized protein LOC131038536 isoform X2 [Cryptomeria japonica]
MAIAKVMAKLKGLFRSGNMVGIDKSGNRYFVRTEDVDGALKEKRWVEFENDSDPTTLPVEWISWLSGQRKKAPTAQQMLDLEVQRERVKMNAAIMQKEEEKRLFRAKSLQQSMDSGDVGPPNLEKLIQQFSDASVTHNEGEEAQTLSHEIHKDTDGLRVLEPRGTGDSFRPGTWQPSENA